MPIQRINEFPEGSGSLTSEDIFLFMDDPMGSGITKKISLSQFLASSNGSNHTHISANITDFNSSVSGLLPVKDIIAGTNISVSSSSGIYTINSSNTTNTDTLEPDGFVNRNDSTISFNNGSRQFSIGPKSPATNYSIYNNGVKVVKNTIENITLPNSTALYFIYFNKTNNALSSKTTAFNFETDIPIAQIYYNADDAKAVFFGEERHGIRMDASTHKYLHNVFGTQYINGLSISNYSLSGNGSSNSDATIAIGNGLIYDEDIEANIIHSNSPSNPFEQVLNPIAVIPVYYKVGSGGEWTDTTANNYPVKTGTTIQYNLLNGGSWSASNSDNPSNNRYIAYWICATTQENEPIISIMGQRIDSSLLQAQSNNSWGGLNLNGLPIVELRPLYRLIYDTKSSFSNSPKGLLVDILDIRGHVDTVTGLTQNDHGSLYGLADDDHYQYIHIDNARTITANHTFTNGLTSSGLLSATSGNFTHLTVNNSGVSITGHTHTGDNILIEGDDFNSAILSKGSDGSKFLQQLIANGLTEAMNTVGGCKAESINDFNSSVSGLIPVKNVIGSGYVNVSSSSGNFTVSATGLQPSGNYAVLNSYSSGSALTSNGTPTGITSNSHFLINSATAAFSNTFDSSINSGDTGSYLYLTTYKNNSTTNTASRIISQVYRGTQASPSGLVSQERLFAIRADIPSNYSASGNLNTACRILMENEGPPATSGNSPSRISIATNSGGSTSLDNVLMINASGLLSYNGYCSIEDGLSAPTPFLTGGSVSGNVSISYGVDKQIQKYTLNGTLTNFIMGAGWPVDRSADVVLEILVNSTTTVMWDIVTAWYNLPPAFTPGTYLVLLRSMSTSTIQGHYIGKKTN